MGVWLKPTFHATPLPLCHETSVCTLEVSALIRGSLPRPWGEGGSPDGGPGEGQPNCSPKCPNSRSPLFQGGTTGGLHLAIIPRPDSTAFTPLKSALEEKGGRSKSDANCVSCLYVGIQINRNLVAFSR